MSRDGPALPGGQEGGAMQRRILVVEDEPDLVAVFRTLCDPTRYEVMLAADVAAARRILARQRLVDLVALNAVLQGGSGIDFCRDLKVAWPSLPVLVVTAQVGDLSAAEAAGADMVLLKPFAPEALQDAVARLLGEAPEPPSGPAA